MKEITKEHLHKLRLNQQKESYGSEAKSMFDNGVFNSDNWNGGDGIVRQYFSHYWVGLFNDQKAAEVDFKISELDFEGDIIISHYCFEEQSYVTIILKGSFHVYGISRQIEDIAYFTWYKSRGRTENALYNGKLMTEEEYLFVVNAIQATGFNFDLE